jgi:hypothetical protein
MIYVHFARSSGQPQNLHIMTMSTPPIYHYRQASAEVSVGENNADKPDRIYKHMGGEA